MPWLMARRLLPRRWALLPALLLGSLLAVLGSPLPSAADALPWVQLGPFEPKPITAIAPDWPSGPPDSADVGRADRTIVAARRDDLVRTRDGGRSWDRLPAPDSDVVELRFAPAARGTAPILFAVANAPVDPRGGQPHRLYRSPDRGTSWTKVLDVPSGGEVRLALSPMMDVDGLAFAGGAGPVLPQ